MYPESKQGRRLFLTMLSATDHGCGGGSKNRVDSCNEDALTLDPFRTQIAARRVIVSIG
jgi:hypothetical protein